MAIILAEEELDKPITHMYYRKKIIPKREEFMIMKNAVFLGVAPCRCGRLNRRFGGSYRLHLQGRKIRERRTSVSR
jgi:hypothetical protein